jgi:hypothetical protein
VQGYLEDAAGQISGVVMPPNGSLYAQATNATDTVGTVVDTLTGQFLFGAVMPGVYDVTFTANAGFSDTTVVGVPVVAGEVTVMDTVFMAMQVR